MADFTKTITNGINVFGNNPSTKWGQANSPYTMTWGVQKWGEGSFSIVFSVEKLITNSLLPDTAMLFEAQKFVTSDLILSEDLSSEILTNGNWRIVFVSDTINVEDRDTAVWTSSTTSTGTFSCMTAGSTTWT